MNIYIDESGSFVSTDAADSWSCVAACMIPETETRRSKSALQQLKRCSSVNYDQELKLRDTKEENYFRFLCDLRELEVALFCVATDASYNNISDIQNHKETQAQKIRENMPYMKYEGGRQGLEKLAIKIENLPPQLYAQLHCQVALIDDVTRRGVLYFVQRLPKCLGRIRWYVDQKNSEKPTFEQAFMELSPALLQSRSIRNPSPMLVGADYSAFSNYFYPADEAPTYLRDTYGINVGDGTKLNLGKLLTGDLSFEDSAHNVGIQIVDLLASGIRRCLRGQFSDNLRAATLLGSLMVSNARDQNAIFLTGFSAGPVNRDSSAHSAVATMDRVARPMLTKAN